MQDRTQKAIEAVLRQHGVAAREMDGPNRWPRPAEAVKAIIQDVKLVTTAPSKVLH